MQKIRYFDHAATTAVSEDVLNEMFQYFSLNYGNASSIYGIGRESKKAIEKVRKQVAIAIGCKPKEIYFTGCGSEADNLAIKGVVYANKDKGKHIITTKIEHPAILNTCRTLEKQGFKVTYISVNKEGFINLEQLESAITEDTILISVMFANNEIGTIEPIKEIGEIAKKNKILFHTDAVQAIGNIKINVEELNIDMLSMSAHKFYGPKGVGALYVKEGTRFEKIQDGGHQEKDKRAGTENVPGIVGMGKAIEIAYKNLEENNNKLLNLRNYFIKQVQEKIPEIEINGSLEKRLAGNCNISFKNIDGEELLFELDKKWICVSTGSACSSGTSNPSHVLTAIGLTAERANSSLRVTFGNENTKEDVDYLIQSLVEICHTGDRPHTAKLAD